MSVRALVVKRRASLWRGCPPHAGRHTRRTTAVVQHYERSMKPIPCWLCRSRRRRVPTLSLTQSTSPAGADTRSPAGFAEAGAVLKTALNDLDPSFIRAEAALQVDLAIAMSQAKWARKRVARRCVRAH